MTIEVIVTRLVVSLFCGGIIGFERGTKHRVAGFRTYILVCLGSTLVMMIGQYSRSVLYTGDPTRIAAQVVSGIGFLGAGTIISNGKNQIKGLTTAAGLWTSAIIGIAIGVGFYIGAALTTLFVLMVMTVLQKVDIFLNRSNPYIKSYVEFESPDAFKEFRKKLLKENVEVMDMEFLMPIEYHCERVEVILLLQFDRRLKSVSVLEEYFEESSGILSSEIF